MSAMSMDRISKAVPASRPLVSTTLEIDSGLSSTSAWLSAEPMDETMPSPTRASTVSSPAPPTSWLIFALTVTLALQMSWIPFFATAVTGGVLMTFGLTDICTASNTSRPARSIPAAVLKSSLILALSADIRAFTTFTTLPFAR